MTQSPFDELDAILAALRNLRRESPRPDTFATLTRLVLSADASLVGEDVYSLAELGLRAQALGLLLGLDELREAVCQMGHRGQLLCSGWFREFIYVFNLVFDAVPHVHRRLQQAQALSGSAYHDGVRAAQDAMASIWADADLRCFLLDGSRSKDERLRLTSTRLQELMTFRFPVGALADDRIPARPRRQPSPTLQPHA